MRLVISLVGLGISVTHTDILVNHNQAAGYCQVYE
jgi:hypothetical protein